MDPFRSDPKPNPRRMYHIVSVPYPGRGHVNPMMNFCKLIATRRPDILISFIVTEEWLGFIGSEPKPHNIRFATVPNVIPSELDRAKDFLAFVDAVYKKLEAPVEQLLDRLEPATPRVIISDMFLPWMVGVGERKNIPVASLWPMSATTFSILYHHELIEANGHLQYLSEQRDELVNYIPGVAPTRLADLPGVFHRGTQNMFSRITEAFSAVTKAQYLLFASAHELESQAFDALQANYPKPNFPLGLLIPDFNLIRDSNSPVPHDYMHWLDKQPQDSVIYISQGSFWSASDDQLEEILAGVHQSGVRFFWVAREADKSRFEKGGGGGASSEGVVVRWCDQLKVLCHPAVGGFWSHCGWNSCKEAAFAGVPVLCFPITADQMTNAKKIVEDRKIGWRMKRYRDDFVSREEISGVLRQFTGSESEEVREVRRRAREVGEICRRIVAEGGSSERSIDAFVNTII